MGNELIISDSTTLKRMLEGDVAGWCREYDTTLTVTNILADTIGAGAKWTESGIVVREITGSDYNRLLTFCDKNRLSWRTTIAETSSLYYSQESGKPVLTNIGSLRDIAQQIGLKVYGVNEYEKRIYLQKNKMYEKITA